LAVFIVAKIYRSEEGVMSMIIYTCYSNVVDQIATDLIPTSDKFEM